MYFSRFAELKFKKIYFVNINAILMNRKFEKSDKIFETNERTNGLFLFFSKEKLYACESAIH